MQDDLIVHLNRDRRHAIEIDRESYAAAGSFEVVLRNHGDGAHAHVGLDGDLAAAATVETPSPFLEAGATERVPVRVESRRRPIEGAVTIATGYGKTSIAAPVSIVAPDELEGAVDVAPTERSAVDAVPGIDGLATAFDGSRPVLAIAGAALLLAGLSAWYVGDPVVLLGVGVVVVAVAGSLAMLLEE